VLPDGTVEVYAVKVSGTGTKGEWKYLLRKDWDFLIEAYPGTQSADSTGIPKYYAIGLADVGTKPSNGGVTTSSNPRLSIEVAPKPSSTTIQYIVDYYQKTAAESIVTASETWLSVTFPDVLLYGSLADAYLFLKSEPALLQYCEQRFHEGMAGMASIVTGEQATMSTQQGA